MDPQWGVVEFNNTNLKLPKILPTYDQGYRSFRDLFNYDARMVSPMAWNGSNGLFADQPDYVAYTSWRNTLAEDAMKDFLVSHADLPRGARLWTFGSARHASDDGWTLAKGALVSGQGFLTLRFDDAEAQLVSPPDQVLRSESLQTLYLGLREPGFACDDRGACAHRSDVAVAGNRSGDRRRVTRSRGAGTCRSAGVAG